MQVLKSNGRRKSVCLFGPVLVLRWSRTPDQDIEEVEFDFRVDLPFRQPLHLQLHDLTSLWFPFFTFTASKLFFHVSYLVIVFQSVQSSRKPINRQVRYHGYGVSDLD